jgi:hypothetical protein
MEHTIDWDHDALVDIMQQDPEKIPLFFKEIYTCSLDEANEAITYIKMFLEDYDSDAADRYKQEAEILLNKWKGADDEGSNQR